MSTAVSLFTRLEMKLDGDFGGQKTALMDIYALRHIWHKIACELFDIFNDQWKQIQLYGLKKSALRLCSQSMYFAPFHDFNGFLEEFYPILTKKI